MQIQRYWEFGKNLFVKDRLRILVFFITSVCNSKCVTCFYWENLNQTNDISLDEVKKTSKSLGHIPSLLLSGGEPFLRKDIDELVEVFYKNNGVKKVSIPTNSLLADKVCLKVRSMLEKCPGTQIHINLSLDGTEETHDSIRGVPGNFKRVQALHDRLQEIKKDFPKQLWVNCASTILNLNIHNMQDLANYVRENMKVDTHGFEVLRGDPMDKKSKVLDKDEFETYRRIALDTEAKYYYKKHNALVAWYIMAKKNYFFNLQRTSIYGEKMDVPCLAGRAAGVLMEDGKVGVCELHEPVGNVKDHDYDFNGVWNNEKTNSLRKYIKKTKCTCTHCVFLYQSIDHNAWVSLVTIPLYGLFSKDGVFGKLGFFNKRRIITSDKVLTKG